MRLATFESGDGPRLGAVVDGDRSVIDLSSGYRRRRGRSEAALDSMLALIDAAPRMHAEMASGKALLCS